MTAHPDGASARGNGEDPGVPEALPRVLVALRQRVDVGEVDRLWIFPPLKRGRREHGLVVASLFLEEGEERRRLVTASYSAERRGLELRVEPSFTEEGHAMPDRLPPVMEGVVRRAGEGQGEPRVVVVDRSQEAYDALMDEFDPNLLEAETT